MKDHLYYEQIGVGPTLVLLHGWGTHSGLWQPIRNQLAQLFTVITIDLPGFGRSKFNNNYPYDLPHLAEQVMAVVPNKAIWLGWSLGGLIAAFIAANHRDRVDKLICVASTPKFIRAPGWPGINKSIFEKLQSVVSTSSEETLLRLLSFQFRNTTIGRRRLQQLRAELFQFGLPQVDALSGGLEILFQSDLREQLGNITCPSMYILGKHDALVPSFIAAKIMQLMPTCAIEVLQGACHAPFLSSTEPFIEVVKQFA